MAANVGGTLLLNSSTNANNIVGSSAATVNLNGGTLKVADALSGSTQTFAAMTLSAISTLDFGSSPAGTNGNNFQFSTLTPGTVAALNTAALTLNVNKWSGTFYDISETADHALDLTQDRFLIGAGSLFASNTLIPGISFFNDSGAFIGNGIQVSVPGGFEIVAVPEPGSAALIGSVALCALIGYRNRRRVSRRTFSH